MGCRRRARLTAADPVDIHYLPNDILRASVRWDGNSTGRAFIPINIVREYAEVPTFD
jgi:hypothetical protein